MNFYQAQDEARKRTHLLLLFFSFSVLTLVILTNFCVAIFILYSDPANSLAGGSPLHFDIEGLGFWNALWAWLNTLVLALGWKKFTWTTLLVCGVISISMGFKWSSLRSGGRVVAESLGGQVILPNTDDRKQKRLLNIVEEVALASGVPVPQVFLLANEQGINAFAAGLSTEDAVVAVTQGALDSFNRDQLQGVIAHEFSHILNGDMRLNMKLIAVLYGILMIGQSGTIFMRMAYPGRRSYRTSRDKNGAAIGFFAFGLALWIIGLLGKFFGALIKSAVSRQREFLADASAVQFTRNPEGIGQALSIIGGAQKQSIIEHPKGDEIAHLFFSSQTGVSKAYQMGLAFFATHPPLEQRILKILPNWKGRFLKLGANDVFEKECSDQEIISGFASQGSSNSTFEAVQGNQGATFHSTDASFQFEEGGGFQLEEKVLSVGQEAKKNANDFGAIKAMLIEPFDAQLVVFSLLLSTDKGTHEKQVAFIQKSFPECVDQVNAIYVKTSKMTPDQTLVILEVAMPTLKLFSKQQYQDVRSLLMQLIHADGKVDLFEWLLFQLLRQYCDRFFGLSSPIKPKYKKLSQLSGYYQVVLSRVVYYGFDVQIDFTSLDDDRSKSQLTHAFDQACKEVGLKNLKLMPFEKCNGVSFSRSVSELSLAYPLVKPLLLKGLTKAVQADSKVNKQEFYVVKGIAAILDCPLFGLEEL